jgi:hypothetical protein
MAGDRVWAPLYHPVERQMGTATHASLTPGVTVGVQWTPPSWVALAGGAEPRPGTLRAALRRTVAPPRVRASVIHGPRNSVLVEVINGVVNSGLVEVIRNLI